MANRRRSITNTFVDHDIRAGADSWFVAGSRRVGGLVDTDRIIRIVARAIGW